MDENILDLRKKPVLPSPLNLAVNYLDRSNLDLSCPDLTINLFSPSFGSEEISPELSPDKSKSGPTFPKFGKMVDGRRICPMCQMTFRNSDKARRHFLSLHSGMGLQCAICCVVMTRRDKLKNHLMKQHYLAPDVAKMFAANASLIAKDSDSALNSKYFKWGACS